MANGASAASQAKVFHFFLTSSFLLLFFFYLSTQIHTSYPRAIIRGNSTRSPDVSDEGCNGLHRYESSETKCTYLTYTARCNPQGYMNYLNLFYCVGGNYPALGYILLLLWLTLLFYLIGNTTARYFCSNGLTRLLKISPTIAGVTLLSLGNGAPDIFSSIVSFMEPDTNVVGLGLPFLFSSWAAYPSPLVIPRDPTIFQTMGSLIGGLLWALLMLPWRGMKLDRVFGCGLLTIYVCFMSLRFVESIGLLQLQ